MRFSKLIRYNIETCSIGELESFFSKEILSHTRPTTELNTFEGLFRSRIIKEEDIEKIKSVKQIWYRDQSVIKLEEQKFGRCNDKGQNFFYSSNTVEATIKELRPTNREYLLIGEFKCRTNSIPPKCHFAGIEILRKSDMWKHLLGNYAYENQFDREIEKFISSCFHRPIDKGREFEYKYTIAFTNILLKNQETSGLVYPSVASSLKLINYGFKPQYVDDNLYCSNVWIYRYLSDGKNISLKPLKYAEIEEGQGESKNSKLEFHDTPNIGKKILKYNW
ncbi:MAG: hypothetical protein CMI36_12540 [Owenweeksia sp.]|nr:hypothetical protein [Owenweeksia sp.]MBF99813.1 hypothetical protein [Owenweeksia sp.]HBF21973.1 hypothetical protein [Cryomorphaceae bacterium]HCQ15676.1 hypothetical protein [Cryomorphaceae bacterium]|tara:strand:+ start:792 stop:1625 length:834 start_codon:yes stop_codon:yes gene_type:complete